MRIGEVARATGVAPATLRAWERRYGVLSPVRTQGGHRVYGARDIARVRTVAALVDAGTRVSHAASRLAAFPDDDQTTVAESTLQRLWDALDALDEPMARATVREATNVLGIPAALDLVFVPALRRLGAEWRLTPRNIAREHFASTMIRAHLVELLPTGSGPPTCLAFCPEGERHDLGLIMAAVALGHEGWHAVVLGADTPLVSVDIVIAEIRPALVLIGAVGRRPVSRLVGRWSPPGCAVVAGGQGFREGDQASLGGQIHAGPFADLGEAVVATVQASPPIPSP